MKRKNVCPVCDSELDEDEVDIGVGNLIENIRCSNCGWTAEEEKYEFIDRG